MKKFSFPATTPLFSYSLTVIKMVLIVSLLTFQNCFAQTNASNADGGTITQHHDGIATMNGSENSANRLIENETASEEKIKGPPFNDNYSTVFNPRNVLIPGDEYLYRSLGGATVEPGEYTGCFSHVPDHTAWYSFTADRANMWISVLPTVEACTTSFGIAVYQASNTIPSNPIACLDYWAIPSGISASFLSKLELTGLTVGAIYTVQLAYYKVGGTLCPPVSRRYAIKIGHPRPCFRCDHICGEMCVLVGTSYPTRSQVIAACKPYKLSPPMNENDTQTRCYSFIPPNDTIYMGEQYSLYYSNCVHIQSGNLLQNNRITNLSVGHTYNICYTVTPGCTIDSIIWPFAYTFSSDLREASKNFSSNVSDFSVYPNPSRNGIFKINFSSAEKENIIISIKDVFGKSFTERPLNNFIGTYSEEINLSSFSKGIYILEIKTENWTINKKLILL
jgi:hypothetical protein